MRPLRLQLQPQNRGRHTLPIPGTARKAARPGRLEGRASSSHPLSTSSLIRPLATSTNDPTVRRTWCGRNASASIVTQTQPPQARFHNASASASSALRRALRSREVMRPLEKARRTRIVRGRGAGLRATPDLAAAPAASSATRSCSDTAGRVRPDARRTSVHIRRVSDGDVLRQEVVQSSRQLSRRERRASIEGCHLPQGVDASIGSPANAARPVSPVSLLIAASSSAWIVGPFS